MIPVPSAPTTKQGAGLALVVAGVLALIQGGIGWILLGIGVVGFGAATFVKGYREAHG